MQDCTIRPYESRDRSRVRHIAWQTAFLGAPADIFFDDESFLCDVLTMYFTDYEPESCFVAECRDEVVGYVMGALAARRMHRIIFWQVLPKLLFKTLVSSVLLSSKNRRFIARLLWSWMRGELRAPADDSQYPALLHINCLEGFRSAGLGGRLIDAFLDYLRQKRARGVWLSTMSPEARGFFEKNGFRVLFEGRRDFWRAATGKDILFWVLGRRFS